MKDMCVIVNHFDRTWFEDEDEAIASAKKLINKTRELQRSHKAPGKLFVVKVIRVVEEPEPPMDIRDPKPSDFPGESA